MLKCNMLIAKFVVDHHIGEGSISSVLLHPSNYLPNLNAQTNSYLLIIFLRINIIYYKSYEFSCFLKFKRYIYFKFQPVDFIFFCHRHKYLDISQSLCYLSIHSYTLYFSLVSWYTVKPVYKPDTYGKFLADFSFFAHIGICK